MTRQVKSKELGCRVDLTKPSWVATRTRVVSDEGDQSDVWKEAASASDAAVWQCKEEAAKPVASADLSD